MKYLFVLLGLAVGSQNLVAQNGFDPYNEATERLYN